jgi:hypothetical protein
MFCIRKKRLEIDNRVWWELVTKAQSMVDDEKIEFNEGITDEDVSHARWGLYGIFIYLE